MPAVWKKIMTQQWVEFQVKAALCLSATRSPNLTKHALLPQEFLAMLALPDAGFRYLPTRPLRNVRSGERAVQRACEGVGNDAGVLAASADAAKSTAEDRCRIQTVLRVRFSAFNLAVSARIIASL
eukprot:2531433-Rhodomonas_salina.2